MRPLAFLLLLAASPARAAADPAAAVRFANALGSHMVLQQAPHSSQVWGSGPPGATLRLKVERWPAPDPTEAVVAVISVPVDAQGHWLAKLPPVAATSGSTPQGHRITATAGSGAAAVLDDVVFGDVWLCGGQSNMQFSVGNASNATAVRSRAPLSNSKPLPTRRLTAPRFAPNRRSLPLRASAP